MQKYRTKAPFIVYVVLTILFAILFCAVAFADGPYMPQTSDAQMQAAPLAKGEIAYTVESNGVAGVYIGSGQSKPLVVGHPGALIGYTTNAIPNSHLAFTYSGNVTEDKGVFTMATGKADTGTVWVAVQEDNRSIDLVTYQMFSVAKGLAGGMAQVHKAISNSVLTLTFTTDDMTASMGVSNVVLYSLPMGERMTVNDATRNTWKIKDRFGIYDLYDARYWCKHSNDGNLGEDWSKYPAQVDVRMNHKVNVFGTTNFWAIGSKISTEFIISDGNEPAMVITAATNNGAYASMANAAKPIQIDSIDATTRTILATFGGTDTLNMNLMTLIYNDELTKYRYPVESKISLVSGRQYKFVWSENASEKTGFFQVGYDAYWQSRRIYIHGITVLMGDDGYPYELHASNNVLSVKRVL